MPAPKPVFRTISLTGMVLFGSDKAKLQRAGRRAPDDLVEQLRGAAKVGVIHVLGTPTVAVASSTTGAYRPDAPTRCANICSAGVFPPTALTRPDGAKRVPLPAMPAAPGACRAAG